MAIALRLDVKQAENSVSSSGDDIEWWNMEEDQRGMSVPKNKREVQDGGHGSRWCKRINERNWELLEV